MLTEEDKIAIKHIKEHFMTLDDPEIFEGVLEVLDKIEIYLLRSKENA